MSNPSCGPPWWCWDGTYIIRVSRSLAVPSRLGLLSRLDCWWGFLWCFTCFGFLGARFLFGMWWVWHLWWLLRCWWDVFTELLHKSGDIYYPPPPRVHSPRKISKLGGP